MRLPRPRFTVRRMMVAVAVVALVLGAVALGVRSREFRNRARYHEVMAASPLLGVKPAPPGFDPVRYTPKWSAYHARLKSSTNGPPAVPGSLSRPTRPCLLWSPTRPCRERIR
jgi:hypothetical protein